MAYRLQIPAKWAQQGWQVKIRDNETTEHPLNPVRSEDEDA